MDRHIAEELTDLYYKDWSKTCLIYRKCRKPCKMKSKKRSTSWLQFEI